MPIIPGSTTNSLPASPLTGGELLNVVQLQGSPVAATTLTVGAAYQIVSLGTTDWSIVGAGPAPAVGVEFVCEAVGTGTGTAQLVESRKATAQEIAEVGSYIHTQTTPAATWSIDHFLDKYPSVQLLGTDGSIFHADVRNPNLNQTVVGPMTVARAGYAILK